MSNGDDTSTKSTIPGGALSGAVLAILAIYAFLTFKPALESQRPSGASLYETPDPRAPKGFSATHARLWEDPLVAAYRHEKSEKQVDSSNANWLNKLGFQPFIECLDANERRVRAAQQRKTLRRHFQTVFRSSKRVLCMPVLLQGGPYADEKEQRIRTSYAVYSALSESGYKLSASQRITYASFPIETFNSITKRWTEIDLVVPLKLFRPESKEEAPESKEEPRPFDSVLVLWLNELQLGDQPLDAIDQIVGMIFHRRSPKLHDNVAVIGPTGSDALIQLTREIQEEEERKNKEDTVRHQVTVYSPRATISTRQLVLPKFPNLRSDKRKQINKFQDRGDADGEPLLVRTIGDDRLLVEQLIKELALRIDRDPISTKPKANIVLVTEQDTIYGRDVVAHFSDVLHEYACCFRGELNLISESFVRGIDGRIPGQAEGESKENANGDEKQEKRSEEKAQGEAQLDYLRRLERDLLNRQKRLRNSGKGDIGAIGVVGTDVYDKLLILRALRGRFPNAVFFTTDLDARYLDPEEFKTTRNLVVASHFGLTLCDELQGSVPPFRDSYQTATYFTCRLALDDKSFLAKLGELDPLDPWGLASYGLKDEIRDKHFLRPLVFEIGRHGPYQLTRPRGVSELVHPTSDRDQSWLYHWGRWLPVAALAFLICVSMNVPMIRRLTWCYVRLAWRPCVTMCACISRLPWSIKKPDAQDDARSTECKTVFHAVNKSWWLLSTLSITVAFLVLAYFDHGREYGEPVVLFGGISVWPSVFLRLAIVFLSFGFICQGIARLKRNARELHIDEEQSCPGGLSHKSKVKRTLCSHARRFFLVTNLYRWSSPLQRKSRPADQRSRSETQQNANSTTDERASCGDRLYDPPEQTYCRNRCYSRRRLFRQYTNRGRGCNRRTRAFVLATVSFFFVFSLFVMTQFPTLPARGELAQIVGRLTTIVAAWSMLVLLFFVVDAIHLCKRFMRKMCENSLPRDRSDLEHLYRGDDYPLDLAREALTIRLIAKRTREVGRLLYYPAVVILLMILSRHPAFDFWNWPAILVIISAIFGVGLIACAIELRIEAARARRNVLQRLRDMHAEALASDNQTLEEGVAVAETVRSHVELTRLTDEELVRGEGDTEEVPNRQPGSLRRRQGFKDQCEKLITEIQQESRGAFAPLSKDPLFFALSIPFGGAGGLILLQSLIHFLG